jgi:Ca-activated chloride channel family protein
LLLSDGFVDPAEGLAAAQRLKAQGAALQVIGIGTVNGAPAPDGTGGFVHDAEGKSVLTKLPEDQLQRLASAGGGRYWNLEQLRELIAALHAESANPLKRDAVATERRVDIWRNEGVWLLPPLLLLTSLLARRGWL